MIKKLLLFIFFFQIVGGSLVFGQQNYDPSIIKKEVIEFIKVGNYKEAYSKIRRCQTSDNSTILNSLLDSLNCVLIDSLICLKKLPSGIFQMGSPEGEDKRRDNEIRIMQVEVDSFYIGFYEVSRLLWNIVMDDTTVTACENYPKDSVNWEDISEFLKKLNKKTGRAYRLPTEKEWEYACRAGTSTPFNTGENLSTNQANFDGFHPYVYSLMERYRQNTLPTDSLPPNPWGLYNMHGNVWEWCSDNINPPGANKEYRVLKGGSWYSSAARCRSASREIVTATTRKKTFGFRLALSCKQNPPN